MSQEQGDSKKHEEPSETAFVIIPCGDDDVFIIVKDKNDPCQIFENKKKFPGGGREKSNATKKGDASLEDAAVREVKEETNLDIFSPWRKALEVHKPSVWDGGSLSPSLHRDVFFESLPPMDISFFCSGERSVSDKSLIPGEEIEYVQWMKKGEILDDIKNRKFFPNHAAAFLWRNIREQFLKTRDFTLLAPIIRRKNLCSWRVDGETLVICFYEQCTLCKHQKSAVRTIFSHARAPVPEAQKKNEFICGLVKFIIFRSDSFFDYVYLESAREKSVYQLPRVKIEQPQSADAILEDEKRKNGWDCERLCVIKRGENFLIVAQSKNEHVWGLEKFCINKHPPLIFLEDDKEWREICESITALNEDRKERLYINYSWWIQRNPKTTTVKP